MDLFSGWKQKILKLYEEFYNQSLVLHVLKNLISYKFKAGYLDCNWMNFGIEVHLAHQL